MTKIHYILVKLMAGRPLFKTSQVLSSAGFSSTVVHFPTVSWTF